MWQSLRPALPAIVAMSCSKAGWSAGWMRTATRALSLASEVAAQPPRELPPKPSLDEVLREVLGDPEALYRNVSQVYQDFLVRCRQYGVNGRAISLATFSRKMATARAGVDAETADTPEWEKALQLSTAMPEDIQAVFPDARSTTERLGPPRFVVYARRPSGESTSR